MKALLPLVLLVILFGGMSLIAGCSGDNDHPRVTIPSAYQGTWLIVAYDDQAQPEAGGLVNVASDGEVTAAEESQVATAQASDDGDVEGDVNTEGELNLTADIDGVIYTLTGTLGTDDTGEGTWVGRENGTLVNSGTFTACRANGAAWAGNWVGTTSGDMSGQGTAVVNGQGVILGEFGIGNGTAELVGVVNGQGDVLALWDGSPMVVAPGSATSANEASGTWRSDTGLSGSWEATRDN